jgi:ring-1,2-phenylacetyl-CoA epoxidase subunit PaaE
MEQIFYPVKVVTIANPTKESTSLSLQIPQEHREKFQFWPGQHLCFRFVIDGKEERRMYSLHNSPYEEGNHMITAKIQSDGFVSRYIADNIKVGDTVEVSVPQGEFTVQPKEKAYKSYYFFAAGSGITPVYSMIKSILLVEPMSQVFLLYGNRGKGDIIFYEELKEWQEQYADQLFITYTLSKRFLDFSLSAWEGKRGRIDDNMVEEFITEHPPTAQNTEYYICGPQGMNQMVWDTLIELGVPTKLIHYEYFSAEGMEYDEDISSVANAEVKAKIGGKSYALSLEQDETILSGLKRIGAPVPYSCQSGICGTCKAKLKDGEVKMKARMALSDDEADKGIVLTCQSLVQSPKADVDFD